MHLADERCTPCISGEGRLESQEIHALVGAADGWALESLDSMIEKHWDFKDFAAALAFVNRVGALAEAENHHPDITFGWGYAMVTLTTHAAEGLTRNDFIMAAKIDAVAAA